MFYVAPSTPLLIILEGSWICCLLTHRLKKSVLSLRSNIPYPMNPLCGYFWTCATLTVNGTRPLSLSKKRSRSQSSVCFRLRFFFLCSVCHPWQKSQQKIFFLIRTFHSANNVVNIGIKLQLLRDTQVHSEGKRCLEKWFVVGLSLSRLYSDNRANANVIIRDWIRLIDSPQPDSKYCF